MIKNKFSVDLHNKLSDLSMSCDSVAAIEGAKFTTVERNELQILIKRAIKYIDEKIKTSK